jgi:hypothetical protein
LQHHAAQVNHSATVAPVLNTKNLQHEKNIAFHFFPLPFICCSCTGKGSRLFQRSAVINIQPKQDRYSALCIAYHQQQAQQVATGTWLCDHQQWIGKRLPEQAKETIAKESGSVGV